MENLFVYGTLKKPEIQRKTIKRVQLGQADTLQGFKRSKIKIQGKSYPIIIPTEKNSSIIKGKILSVNKKELKKLDNYEGEEYKRMKITLKSRKTALVYSKREQ